MNKKCFPSFMNIIETTILWLPAYINFLLHTAEVAEILYLFQFGTHIFQFGLLKYCSQNKFRKSNWLKDNTLLFPHTYGCNFFLKISVVSVGPLFTTGDVSVPNSRIATARYFVPDKTINGFRTHQIHYLRNYVQSNVHSSGTYQPCRHRYRCCYFDTTRLCMDLLL